MKYVYVVTRTVKNEPANILEIPNLGVHTSYEKAKKHFESVRLARIQYGARNLYTHPGFTQPGPYSVLRTSFFTHENGMTEEVRLEKWTVSKKAKKTQKVVRPRAGYLCSECAKSMGGRWPKDHCATAHTGNCSFCHEEKSLVSTSDYLWTNEKTLKDWD